MGLIDKADEAKLLSEQVSNYLLQRKPWAA